MSYIFTFSSRNSAMRFADAVREYGGKAAFVNTPRLEGRGCGLSVKCTDLATAESIINRGHYSLIAVYKFDGSTYKTLFSVGK